MRDLLRLFTPPEWAAWNVFGRLAYAAVFIGLMVPVVWVARKLGDLAVYLLFGG